jgi:hypothetical protein
MAIHKHAFILWVAIRDGLMTGDRLLKWGAKVDVNCLICRNIIECCDHLCFCYGFSRRIWRAVMQRCLQVNIPTNWEDILRKGLGEWLGKKLKAVVCKLAWGSAVYSIWRHQNDVKFGNHLNSEEKF